MAAAGKRQRDAGTADWNGSNKRRIQPAGDREQQSLLPTADDTTYRILCPEGKIGGVIGKGGNVIKSIRRESRARIKVTDAVPGVDERVILIWSSPLEERGTEGKKREKEKDGNVGAKKNRDGAAEEQEFLCPAQEALFKIHARILEVEDGKPGEKEVEAPGQVTARLLVPNNQIGCLLGKKGKVIQSMREETRAQIRILSKDQVPGCALPSDELVQISGDFTVVKDAMYRISSRIHENPPRSRPQNAAAFLPPEPSFPTGPNTHFPDNFLPLGNSYLGSGDVGDPLAGLGSRSFPGYGGFGSIDSKPSWPLGSSAAPILPPLHAPHKESTKTSNKQEFSLRVLWRSDKVGHVIGKGGSAIRYLQDCTGAHIKVEDPVPDSDERVITVSANESFDTAVSPVIEAVYQLQCKRVGSKGQDESTTTMRLLVPSKQIGCLLGKKGAVISEMRKKTAADIKVLKKDLPKCAQGSEEVVQIIGERPIAQVALLEVLGKLRNDVFKDQINVQATAGAVTGSLPRLGDNYDPTSAGQMYPHSGFSLQEGSRYMSGSYGPLEYYQGYGIDYGTLSAYGEGLPIGHETPGGRNALTERLYNISGPSVEATVPARVGNTAHEIGTFNSSKMRRISAEKARVRGSLP